MLLNSNSIGGNIMKNYFQTPSIQIFLCVQLRICHVYRNKKNIHNSVNWHKIMEKIHSGIMYATHLFPHGSLYFFLFVSWVVGWEHSRWCFQSPLVLGVETVHRTRSVVQNVESWNRLDLVFVTIFRMFCFVHMKSDCILIKKVISI